MLCAYLLSWLLLRPMLHKNRNIRVRSKNKMSKVDDESHDYIHFCFKRNLLKIVFQKRPRQGDAIASEIAATDQEKREKREGHQVMQKNSLTKRRERDKFFDLWPVRFL